MQVVRGQAGQQKQQQPMMGTMVQISHALFLFISWARMDKAGYRIWKK
jgi:hypothetical protein